MKQTQRFLTVLYIGRSEPGTNDERGASFFLLFPTSETYLPYLTKIHVKGKLVVLFAGYVAIIWYNCVENILNVLVSVSCS